MNFRKNSKGITLIALVVTIIVLLILAGVTLKLVAGSNGIIGKASKANEEYTISEAKEKLELAIAELMMEERLAGNSPTKDSLMNLNNYGMSVESTDSFPVEVVCDTYKFEIDANYGVTYIGKATGIMISCSVSPSGYTNQNVTATIKITCNEGIKTVKQIEPTEEDITVSGTECVITKENISANTTFKYEVTDSKGNTDIKIAQITNIDKDEPSSCTIIANATDNEIEITATAEDAGSGIGRYEYYVNDEKKGESDKNTYTVENLATGTYSVYVIAYDKAENSKKSDTVTDIKVSRIYTNITAQMVADHPEKYYGLKVTNYESTNGQDDWKIFYSDGEHIFLITGDYVDLLRTNEGTTKLDTNTGMNKIGTKYVVRWNPIPSSLQTVNDTVKTRFKATGYTLNCEYESSRCVSTLLNTSNWESYKDNSGKAEYVIGGSTIEMWMESWNELCDKKYNKPSDKLYCNNTWYQRLLCGN